MTPLIKHVQAPLFITGTDTGIGKTVVAALIRRALQEQGRDVAYMKPIQTGCEWRDGEWIAPDPDFVGRMTGPCAAPAVSAAVCPYALHQPASPHLAAANEKVTITPDRLCAAYRQLAAAHESVLVEGAGGVQVPITNDFSMRDLMVMLGLPVCIVARAGLGTLNHTLLTIEALRKVNLTIAGIVLVQTDPAPWGDIETNNAATLTQLGQVPLWACIPHSPEIASGRTSPAEFATWADAIIHPTAP